MDEGWEQVESIRSFWNPSKEGEEITGKLVAIGDSAYGKEFTLAVTEDGKERNIKLPAHKMLQNLMSSCVLGDLVKAVFTGTQPPKVKGESPLKVYAVYRKPLGEKVQ